MDQYNKQLLKALVDSKSKSITFVQPLSKSQTLKEFWSVRKDGFDTGFVFCKICGSIIKFNSQTWSTLIRHRNGHRDLNPPTVSIHEMKNNQSIEKNNKILKKILKKNHRPKIKQIIRTRKNISKTEYLVNWKDFPKLTCWVPRTLLAKYWSDCLPSIFRVYKEE